MELVPVLESQKSDYNNFIAASLSGSFLQSWEWGEWQTQLGRKVYRYWIVDDNKRVGSIQLIQMSLPFGKYYLYSPYGSVLTEGDNFQSIFNDLISKFPQAVFIRLEPKYFSPGDIRPSNLVKSVNIQPAKTLVIDLNQSAEEILAQMHHKTRYNIKVAERHGVEIKDEFDISVGHGLFFEEALALILETAKRQKFTTFLPKYYQQMVDYFSVQHHQSNLKLHIYKAIFQNQLLAVAVILDYGNTRTFLFGGSSQFHKNVMAAYKLHFQAILDAKNMGLHFYDFWGTETSKGEIPGFVRFKLGFGGMEKIYAGAYDFVIRPWGYSIYKVARNLRRLVK